MHGFVDSRDTRGRDRLSGASKLRFYNTNKSHTPCKRRIDEPEKIQKRKNGVYAVSKFPHHLAVTLCSILTAFCSSLVECLLTLLTL